MNDVVRAAGGVPVRVVEGVAEVLVVHRPRYDDWTFPKGKCEAGESDESCAIREVEEEAGLLCVLEEELPVTEYLDDKDRPKRVRWWRMRVAGGELAFLHEVDEAVWLTVPEAAARLSYPRDHVILEAAAG